MSTDSFALGAAFLALLGAPVVAPIAARYVSRMPDRLRAVAATIFVGWVAVIGVACFFGVSTPIYELDAAFLALTYFVLATTLLLAFRFRPRILGAGIGALGILFLAAGVFAGTVGALGVLFVVGDSVPLYEVALTPDYRCYVMPYGNATTSVNGYEVVLARQMPLLPVLERPSRTARFDDASYDLVPAELCQSMLHGSAG